MLLEALPHADQACHPLVGLPFHRFVQVATELNGVKCSSFQGV